MSGGQGAAPGRADANQASEEELVRELRAAHADQKRAAAEGAAARQRRREAAEGLRALGRPMSWIADQIGVTQQAVDGFMKYKERRGRRGQGQATTHEREGGEATGE